jgi:alpha-tubulin suppressor-like RCC1 family protein
MDEEYAFDLVRKIVRSQVFYDQTIEERKKTLEQILETRDITKDQLLNLINESVEQTEQKKIKQMLPILEKFDYNTFLRFIITGDIKGKDLLAVCNTSKKFNNYCNKDFEVRDFQGKIIEVKTQYLFRLLLGKMGIRLYPTKSPKDIYIDHTIGGQVWTVGSANSPHLLGLGDIEYKGVPMPIPNHNNIIQVSAGVFHSLILDSRGHVWGFGGNNSGQLGLGNIEGQFSPYLIPDLKGIVRVVAGNNFSLVLDNQGHVWSFGLNYYGQLGLGDQNGRLIPTIIPNLNNIVQISTGLGFSLALDNQGHVWSFGYNENYQLAQPSVNGIYSVPTIISNLNNIIQISAGTHHSLCLDNEGHVWSFGDNVEGRAGSDDRHVSNVPALIPTLNNIIQVSAGNEHSLCLDADGHVWSFGEYKKLGRGNYNKSFSILPNVIPNFNNIIQISAGIDYSLCLDQQGKVWAFGETFGKTLGTLNNKTKYSPVLIPGLDNIFQISTNDKHSLVIRRH